MCLEGDVQGLRFFVGVFDLEFSQRRRAVKAPVHRLEAAVDKAALHDALERTDLIRFVARVHRQIGVFPLAENTEALEVFFLQRDLLGGVGAAFCLHFVTAQIAAKGFFDLVFNRQAVAIPAGDIDSVHALELACLDDHVFQDLVDGVTHVDLAVGIGWAVMQDETGRVDARIAQFFVNAFVFPFLDPARLALGQVAAHGKGSVRQVQGAAIVGFLIGHGDTWRGVESFDRPSPNDVLGMRGIFSRLP